MSKVPTPRFDLLKMKHYAFGSLQFSRGCPFQCEFCDIIVTFGRRPRIKTSAQVIAELDAILKAKVPIVFIVDDNLIGNKKAIKVVLQDVIAWQERHNYPLSIFTEASIDLADDPELMDLMVRANFIATFVGIESPDEESLREAKKFQNVRAGGTLLEKVHRIQDAGMEVWCGMIMGFDNDDEGIFERQIRFVQESRIAFSMSGMLAAIPKTPLHARLAAEGRLDTDDVCEFGTNVIPLEDEPRGAARRLHPRHQRDLRARDLLRSDRRALPRPVVRHRHQEAAQLALLAPPVPGRAGVLRPGDRPVRPADDPRPRGRAAPRVPPPPLAAAQGPPPPGPRAQLPVPHDHALSFLQPGPARGQPRDAIDQQFLIESPSQGPAVGRLRRDQGPVAGRRWRPAAAAVPGPAHHQPQRGPGRAGPAARARSQREKYGGLFYLGIGGVLLLIVLVGWFGHGLWSNRDIWADVYTLNEAKRPESERLDAALRLARNPRLDDGPRMEMALQKGLPELARYLLAESVSTEPVAHDPRAYALSVSRSQGWPDWLRLLLARAAGLRRGPGLRHPARGPR